MRENIDDILQSMTSVVDNAYKKSGLYFCVVVIPAALAFINREALVAFDRDLYNGLPIALSFICLCHLLYNSVTVSKTLNSNWIIPIKSIVLSAAFGLTCWQSASSVNEVFSESASDFPITTVIVGALYFIEYGLFVVSLLFIFGLICLVMLAQNVFLVDSTHRILRGEIARFRWLLGFFLRGAVAILFISSAFAFSYAIGSIADFSIESLAWKYDFSDHNRCSNPEVKFARKVVFLGGNYVLIRKIDQARNTYVYNSVKCQL